MNESFLSLMEHGETARGMQIALLTSCLCSKPCSEASSETGVSRMLSSI